MCARFKLLGMCVFFVCGFVLCTVFFECDCIQIFCVCACVGRACVCVLMCLYFCPVLRFFILRFFTMIQLYFRAVLLLLTALFFSSQMPSRGPHFLAFCPIAGCSRSKKNHGGSTRAGGLPMTQIGIPYPATSGLAAHSTRTQSTQPRCPMISKS